MADQAYVIGSGERPLWLGLGPIRLGVLAAALLAAVSISYTGLPLPVAAAPLVLATGWSFAALGGMPLHELTMARASLIGRSIAGGTRSPAGLATVTPVEAQPATNRPLPLKLPRECGRLSLLAMQVDGFELGVLAERGRQGWELVCMLRVVGDAGFCLLEPAEQSRRLEGWGDVLTALAGEYADRCRIQWIESTDRGGARSLAELASGSAEDLAKEVTSQSLSHRTVIAVRVLTREKDVAVAARQAEPLYRLLASRLVAAELVAEPLAAEEVMGQLRRFSSGEVSHNCPVSTGARVGPTSRLETWDSVRTDDLWHRCYLITGWPRIAVGPSWLSPLLTEGPIVGSRSVAMHFEAVRPDLANRRARAARQSASLDVDDRTRLGFGVGARERRTQHEADSAEEELAAGHVQHRVAGLILVSAGSLDELEDACRQTVAAASAARLDVRPLHGRQALAWAAAMPLCRLAHRAPA